MKNVAIIPAAWVKLCNYAKNTDKFSYEEKYKHIRYIIRHVCKSGNIDLKVTGLENIPKKDGFLMCGNHQGLFDIIAIVESFDRPIAGVIKKEFASIPFIKQILQCTHSYGMDREDVRQSMKVIQNVSKDLENGRNIVIFPEGTRKAKLKKVKAKPGAVHIAMSAGADVLFFEVHPDPDNALCDGPNMLYLKDAEKVFAKCKSIFEIVRND